MSERQKNLLDDMLCFEVYSTEHAFARLYKGLLAPLGLTYPQFLVLVVLWQEDAQTVNGIGAQVGLESSTLTPLLKRMEKAGLLTRARDEEDERRVRVRLSPRGAALRSEARGIATCVAKATGMPEAELRQLMASMRRLRQGLQNAA